MKRHFERGERVSVPYNQQHVIAHILSGPHKYTDDEMEDKRVRTYYVARVRGSTNTVKTPIIQISKLPKRAA